jgi:hypothetical protein
MKTTLAVERKKGKVLSYFTDMSEVALCAIFLPKNIQNSGPSNGIS